MTACVPCGYDSLCTMRVWRPGWPCGYDGQVDHAGMPASVPCGYAS